MLGTAYFTEHSTPRRCRTRGRRPHVPSSKPTMSKSALNIRSGQLRFPDFCYRGTWRPTMLATVEGAVCVGSAPSGERVSRPASLSRQTLFAILFQIMFERPGQAGTAPSREPEKTKENRYSGAGDPPPFGVPSDRAARTSPPPPRVESRASKPHKSSIRRTRNSSRIAPARSYSTLISIVCATLSAARHPNQQSREGAGGD